MAISGNFQAFQARVQPWTGNLDPNLPSTRHDSVADAPVVPTLVPGKDTGGGAPFASPVTLIMRAIGINRDASRTTDTPNTGYRGGAFAGTEPFRSEHDMSAGNGYWPGSQSSPVGRGGTSIPGPMMGTQVQGGFNGRRPAWFPVNHAAVAETRQAYAAQFHDGLANYANARVWQGRADAAKAHGNSATTRVTGHQYRAQPAPVIDETQTQDQYPTKGYSTAFTGRMLAKGVPGTDGFMDGSNTEEYVTTYHTGGTHAQRNFVANYSSPTIGAMYSKNTPRGVLPNHIDTPYPQAALSNGYKTGGMPPNQRQLLKRFVTPTLYRTPPSEAATISVVNDGGAPSNTIGMGF